MMENDELIYKALEDLEDQVPDDVYALTFTDVSQIELFKKYIELGRNIPILPHSDTSLHHKTLKVKKYANSLYKALLYADDLEKAASLSELFGKTYNAPKLSDYMKPLLDDFYKEMRNTGLNQKNTKKITTALKRHYIQKYKKK